MRACIILFCFFALRLTGQNTFHIKYQIKFYTAKGKPISCAGAKQDSIYINTNKGILEKHSYNSSTGYFYIDIHTTWPRFTIVWKENTETMFFTIDCATEYKDVYIDSLYFKPGVFSVVNTCTKNITAEDSVSRHLAFPDYSLYKQPTADFNSFKEDATLITDGTCR